MASRSNEAIAAIVFDGFGAASLLSAPFIGWYLMPFWLYLRMVFPISFPFGITTLLGTLLVLADKLTVVRYSGLALATQVCFRSLK